MIMNKKKLDLTIVPKTKHEQAIMMHIGIYCQNAYRRLKARNNYININRVMREAEKDLRKAGVFHIYLLERFYVKEKREKPCIHKGKK